MTALEILVQELVFAASYGDPRKVLAKAKQKGTPDKVVEQAIAIAIDRCCCGQPWRKVPPKTTARALKALKALKTDPMTQAGSGTAGRMPASESLWAARHLRATGAKHGRAFFRSGPTAWECGQGGGFFRSQIREGGSQSVHAGKA
jgi:hypothetical protein